jgi:antitoxin CptB
MPTEPGNVVSDPRRLARIRWRCRRGLLENDLILARFLDAKAAGLTDDEVAMLDRLLELSDNELWDLIAGRSEPTDVAVGPLVETLRRI